MDLRVLGPVEVVGHQGQVALGGPQRRLLLALLAARAGEVVSADALADALWGDEPPPAATVVLQSQLSRLRKLVEPSRAARAPATVIRSAGDGYLLDLTGHGFDAREFGALLTRSRDELRSGSADRAAAGLTEALALWRGPAYGDLAGHRVLADAAAELDELRLTARELWADAELDRGEHRQLVGELESLVREHPFRERFTAQLMLALYRSGRQADALATYQRSRRRLVRDLGIEPGPELRTLDQQILLQSPELDHRYAARPTPVVLAGPRTSFVGRETELAGIRDALSRRQLVTITGPGGVGKTRLALEVAAAVAPGLRHGAARCDLAAVPSTAATAVEDAVAAAVGHRTPAAEGQDLAGFLAGQELLLVLDNADHLVPATAALAGRLLERCPQLRLLVTSREPLGVSGERLVRLAPLPVDGAAVRLFTDRAALSAPGGPLDPEAVAQVCRRLDGLPLALELAASRLRSVPLEHVVTGLDAPLPSGGTHGTLREVIAWTVDLLDEPSRALLRRLAVFSGGFTAPAAARVCGVEGDPVEALAALVDRSLVQLDPRERRYRLLETIRADGLERLDAAGETASFRARHLSWCLGLTAEPETAEVEDPDRFRALGAELSNVTAALATADDVAAAALLAVAAAPCWIHAGRFGEARRWLEQAVASTPDGDRVQRLARWRLGWVLSRQHDLDAARQALTAALGDPAYTDELALETEILLAQVEVESGDLASGQARLSKQLASPEVQNSVRRRAAVMLGLGRRAMLAGELPEATKLLDEAADAAREAGAWDTLVHALVGLVQAESGRGHLDRAGGAVAEALTVARRRRLLGAMPTLLGSAATVAFRSDDVELAVARFTEALSAARQAGDLRAELATVNNLGVIAVQGGRPLDAIEQFEQAIELADRVGDHRTVIMITANLSEAVLTGTHDVRRALRLARDALALARSADVPVAAMFALESASYALVERGTPDDLRLAGRLLGGVAAGHEAVGRRSDAAGQVALALERIRTGLGVPEADRVFAAGHTAGIDVVATEFLSV